MISWFICPSRGVVTPVRLGMDRHNDPYLCGLPPQIFVEADVIIRQVRRKYVRIDVNFVNDIYSFHLRLYLFYIFVLPRELISYLNPFGGAPVVPL